MNYKRGLGTGILFMFSLLLVMSMVSALTISAPTNNTDIDKSDGANITVGHEGSEYSNCTVYHTDFGETAEETDGFAGNDTGNFSALGVFYIPDANVKIGCHQIVRLNCLNETDSANATGTYCYFDHETADIIKILTDVLGEAGVQVFSLMALIIIIILWAYAKKKKVIPKM